MSHPVCKIIRAGVAKFTPLVWVHCCMHMRTFYGMRPCWKTFGRVNRRN
jgi:hypothetical protein